MNRTLSLSPSAGAARCLVASRRAALLIGLFAWLFFYCLASSSQCLAQHKRPPNIVLILADDLGYGDLGCYGQKTLATPALDRLAAEGLRFTQHYAGSTVCAPSRGVLMTGLHTGHSPIRSNAEALLPEAITTTAEALKSAGYATGCVGKWGVGHPPPLDDPKRQGFDRFFGYINMYHAHNFYPEFLIADGREYPLANRVFSEWREYQDLEHPKAGMGIAERRAQYAPHLITEQALSFIRANRQRPFFLYFAMNVPHANNEAGRSERTNHNGMEVPELGRFAKEDWPAPEKGFAAMIRNIDGDVQKLVDTLRKLDIAENTLVLFTSDNGPHHEGGHDHTFFDSNGPLRGYKRDLYEGGIRVPLVAWWPGTIAPGRTSDHISAFWDLLPTFCELAGAAKPKGIDGLSMVPTLLDRCNEQSQHEAMTWYFPAAGGKRAVRLGQWKAVQVGLNKNPDAPLELYDLATDLGEERNVANEHPEIVARARAALDEAYMPEQE